MWFLGSPAGIAFAKLFYPETELSKSTRKTLIFPRTSFITVLDAACYGAFAGMLLSLGIIANAIAFMSAFRFLNEIVAWLGELVGYGDTNQYAWSIEEFGAYLFMPMVFMMGVPWNECYHVGKLIGLKIFVNEFIAYKELGRMISGTRKVTYRSEAIATFALCGFTNPASFGVMLSTMIALTPDQRKNIIYTIGRAFISGIATCFMSACVAGKFVTRQPSVLSLMFVLSFSGMLLSETHPHIEL